MKTKKLAEKAGLEFNEIKDVFSEETLQTMVNEKLIKVKGGYIPYSGGPGTPTNGTCGCSL